jgi:hypothetical protein
MLDKGRGSIVPYELEGRLDLESAHFPLFGTIDIKCDSLGKKITIIHI